MDLFTTMTYNACDWSIFARYRQGITLNSSMFYFFNEERPDEMD